MRYFINLLLHSYFYLFLIMSIILIPGVHDVYGNESEECEILDNDSNENEGLKNEPFKFETSFKGTDNLNKNVEIDITLQGNTETKPAIKTNTEKLFITKYYGEQPKTVLSVTIPNNKINLDDVKVNPTEFIISGKTTSSVAADSILPKLILEKMTKDECSITIEYKDQTEIETFGKYAGKFIISLEGFESKSIDVEYQIQLSPLVLTIFTLVGVVIGLVLAIKLKKVNEKDEKDKKLKTNKAIISHLNNHVKFLNVLVMATEHKTRIESFHELQLRWFEISKSGNYTNLNNIDTSKLQDILKHYESVIENWSTSIKIGTSPKLDLFPTHNENLKDPLKKTKEALKKDYSQMKKTSDENENAGTAKPDFVIKWLIKNIENINPLWKEISSFKDDCKGCTNPDKFSECIKDKIISEKPMIVQELIDSLEGSSTNIFGDKNVITGVTVVFSLFTALPLALFGVTYFPGHPVTDLVIATGVGFGIFTSREIGKKIKNLF